VHGARDRPGGDCERLNPNALHDFTHHVAGAVPRLETLLADSESRKLSGLERYILARLKGDAGPAFLDAQPLYVAIKTREMIGAVAVFGRTPNLKRLSDGEWWRAGAAGFDIADSGIEAIGRFLAELQRTYPYSRSSTEGPQALFGRLYQWLAFGGSASLSNTRRIAWTGFQRSPPTLSIGDRGLAAPAYLRAL
jgi:hypothetical protein